MRCTQCGFEYRGQYKYCGNCGAHLADEKVVRTREAEDHVKLLGRALRKARPHMGAGTWRWGLRGSAKGC